METLHSRLDLSSISEDIFNLLCESPIFHRCQNVFHEATGQNLCLRPAEKEVMNAEVNQLTCVPIHYRKRTVAILETEYGDENIVFWLSCMATQLSRYAEKQVDIMGSNLGNEQGA